MQIKRIWVKLISQDEKINDNLRRQLVYTDNLIELNDLKNFVKKLVYDYNKALVLSSPTIITSLAGNAKQCLHADYDLDDSRSKNSLFLIAALQDETSLRVVIDDRESIVYFNKGDLFVGLGGNSYSRDNVRAHWYAETTGSSREEDVTYHVEEREIKPPYTKLTLEHIANIERKRGIKRRRIDNINMSD